jgi:hypothetical protein
MTERYIPRFVAAYEEAARQNPANPLSWYVRADEYREQGDLESWQRTIDAALAMPHDSPEQLCRRAYAQLTRGDWSGWTDYDARRFHANDRSPATSMDEWVRWTHRAWDGTEDLTDRTILVLFEQGMGDNIQMLRFLLPLAERAQSVIVWTYPRVVPFVQCNFGDRVTVMIHGVDKPFTFDRYASIMSLPRLFGQLPPFVPLHGPGRRPKLPVRRRPIRAGICWAGNPEYGNDEQRSMPAAFLAPLLARTDIEWHSLQVGARGGDADQYPSLIRPWPRLMNFAETADLMEELDLIVAVDTAVGHLAGCLGIPTYLVLPFCSEWRWGLGDRTPWYPSMQLIRQPAPDDWFGAVAQLQILLDEFCRSRPEPMETNGQASAPFALSATY